MPHVTLSPRGCWSGNSELFVQSSNYYKNAAARCNFLLLKFGLYRENAWNEWALLCCTYKDILGLGICFQVLVKGSFSLSKQLISTLAFEGCWRNMSRYHFGLSCIYVLVYIAIWYDVLVGVIFGSGLGMYNVHVLQVQKYGWKNI